MRRRGVSGVILAAGEGRRMGKLGQHIPKACLPLMSKPLLAHNLNMLHNLGIQDVIIVLSKKNRDVIERVAKTNAPSGVRLKFIEQPHQHGIADALLHTSSVTGEHIVLVLGDTYFVPSNLALGLNTLLNNAQQGVAAVLSIRSVENTDLIRRECTIRIDSAGYLLEIQEKPAEPWNNLKPCGVYFFTRSIFSAIAETPPSLLRGEIEITDAISTLITQGYRVRCLESITRDYNLSSPEDLLRCNLTELKKTDQAFVVGDRSYLHPCSVIEDSLIGSGVNITAPVLIKRSIVLDNVSIHEACSIENSVIGPDFVLSCLSRG